MKKLILALFIFALSSGVSAQFVGLSSEVVQVWDGLVGETDLTGYTTYHIYADFENSNDFLSAIYGFQLDQNPFEVTPDSSDVFINSECGCYDFEFGGILPNYFNAGMLSVFPEAAYDSYWTIGLTPGQNGFLNVVSTASNPAPDELATANPCDAFIDDGAIFTLFGEPHGTAGSDHRVLIAQITTCSQVWEMKACFQVFVNGTQQEIQEVCLDFPVVFENPCLSSDLAPTIVQTDYDCIANTANVSVAGAEGYSYALFDFSADGIISTQLGGFALNALPAGDYLLIVNGDWDCTNEIAFTVTPPAELDTNANGLCDSQETTGCHDPLACNYDPETAISNPALCTYLETHLIVGESMPPQFSLQTYTYGGPATSTYEWTAINGAIINGQGAATILVNWGMQGVNGQLMVQETDENGCVGPIVYLNIVPINGIDDVTSVDEASNQSGVTVYPNPASTDIFFNHSLPQAAGIPYQLIVFDLNGRMIERIETHDQVLRLDVSAYASGSYIAVLTNGEYSLRKQLVIQR